MTGQPIVSWTGAGLLRAVTYYLIDADVFRHRQRGQIYTFANEDEMLEWLAILNQVGREVWRGHASETPSLPWGGGRSHAVVHAAYA
jgi:hypothetical protein